MTRSLLLVRHGQIEANARGRWHGSTDSPLTRIGRQELKWRAFAIGGLLIHVFLLGPAAAYFASRAGWGDPKR